MVNISRRTVVRGTLGAITGTLARPYIERKGVEAIVRGHLGGGQNHTTAIHKLLTLELLHRQFLDPR